MSTPALPAGYALDDPPLPSGYKADTPKTVRAMQQGVGGSPMFVDVPVPPGGDPEQIKQQFESAGQKGYQQGAKTGLEMTGGTVGGEAAAGMRGVVGVLARMLGAGIGAGTGNVVGQAAGTGTVDPSETGKTAALYAGGQGIAETVGAGLSSLRGLLSKLMYTGEAAADGTPVLSKIGRAIVHPTELPENILRAAVPPPQEALEAAAKQAGETNAAKLEEQMTSAEAARQKQLADFSKLEMQDATEQAAAVKRQQAAARLAAKSVPEPSPPNAFAGATSTAPQPPRIETDSLGIRWAVAQDGARVSIPKGIADADVAAYAAPKLDEQRSILGGIKGDIPKGTSTPFGDNVTTTAPAKIQYVDKFGKQTTGSIVDPSSPPPDVKVTYQSVPGKELYQKMMSGDGNAIREWMRRGLELPDNVKFMVEDAGKKPWRNLEK
jgi:hypothetical protein